MQEPAQEPRLHGVKHRLIRVPAPQPRHRGGHLRLMEGTAHQPPCHVDPWYRSIPLSPISTITRTDRVDPAQTRSKSVRSVTGRPCRLTAQAVEAELDGAETDPVAAAIDARAAGVEPVLGGDRGGGCCRRNRCGRG